MNDDKTRPRLSLKRKAPSADTSVPASEAGAGIIVSRRKKVVVNTGPKRNKKPLADDRPPASRMPQPGNRQPGKTKEKKQPAPPPKKAVEVLPPPPKQPHPGRSPRLMRPVKAAQTLSTHWPGLFAGGQLRPLAIGVREQLFADAEHRALPLSKKVIRRCLKTLTRTETYLSSLTAGVACYNADGSVDSLVPPERETAAGLKLAQVRADKLKKQAAKTAATDEKKEH